MILLFGRAVLGMTVLFLGFVEYTHCKGRQHSLRTDRSRGLFVEVCAAVV